MPRRAGKVRVIGGEWRGRKLSIADVEGLRPTPDRVRETLFNWLQAVVPGSRCLDLFAGSGALGVEAASRGARQVDLVERSPEVVQVLKTELEPLNSPTLQVIQQDALSFLNGSPSPYDVVFLDPPFGHGMLVSVLDRLEGGGWLKSRAWVYIECEQGLALDGVPAGWQQHRHKKAGQVGYYLFLRDAADG